MSHRVVAPRPAPSEIDPFGADRWRLKSATSRDPSSTQDDKRETQDDKGETGNENGKEAAGKKVAMPLCRHRHYRTLEATLVAISLRGCDGTPPRAAQSCGSPCCDASGPCSRPCPAR